VIKTGSKLKFILEKDPAIQEITDIIVKFVQRDDMFCFSLGLSKINQDDTVDYGEIYNLRGIKKDYKMIFTSTEVETIIMKFKSFNVKYYYCSSVFGGCFLNDSKDLYRLVKYIYHTLEFPDNYLSELKNGLMKNE